MQTSILPEISSRSFNEIQGRKMTYQITMRGHDGIVLASDQREYMEPQPLAGDEGSGPTLNLISKVRFDPTRQYAWAYAGGRNSLFAAGHLERAFENGIPDGTLERTLRDCGDRGWKETLPSSGSTVILG
jgi:hypothetical protein